MEYTHLGRSGCRWAGCRLTTSTSTRCITSTAAPRSRGVGTDTAWRRLSRPWACAGGLGAV